jgi:single-strand DNA-binding protein
MINRIVLLGRATRDPETRATNAGKMVSTFTLACERDFKSASGDKETDFIPIVCWSKTSEIVEKYVNKGNMIAIDGRLQIRTYEDREGKKRTIAEVVADRVHLLGSKTERQAVTQDEMTPLDDLPF